MNRLQDKVIIVTESSSGLGRGIAKACAVEGAKLVIADIHEQPTAGGFEDDASLTTAESIQKAGGEALFVQCDVTKSDQVAHLVAEGSRRSAVSMS
jgi:NAD(P)-dependent dehydrogenase (short-subunit alcohol dehydrogenase family)